MFAGMGARALLPVLVAALLTTAAAADERAAFLAGHEDLPLMPGLTQVEDAAVAFDTSSGRIIVAWATGPVERAAVLAFYADTLPELGWTRMRADRFQREGETLQLEFAAGDLLTVRFTVAPE